MIYGSHHSIHYATALRLTWTYTQLWLLSRKSFRVDWEKRLFPTPFFISKDKKNSIKTRTPFYYRYSASGRFELTKSIFFFAIFSPSRLFKAAHLLLNLFGSSRMPGKKKKKKKLPSLLGGAHPSNKAVYRINKLQGGFSSFQSLSFFPSLPQLQKLQSEKLKYYVQVGWLTCASVFGLEKLSVRKKKKESKEEWWNKKRGEKGVLRSRGGGNTSPRCLIVVWQDMNRRSNKPGLFCLARKYIRRRPILALVPQALWLWSVIALRLKR